jgi:uncharacterized protein (DUF1778 family)
LPEFKTSTVRQQSDSVIDLDSLSRLMSAQLSEPFADRECCPFRVTLIDAPETLQYVVVAYRHAVGDAHSCVLILKAILEHCQTGNWTGNLRIADVPKLRQLFQHETGWRLCVPRAGKLVSDIFSGLRCFRPIPDNLRNTRETCRIHKSGLETSCLKAAARRYGVSIQDFLMAAQAEAIAEVVGSSSSFTLKPKQLLQITSLMDLRRFASGELDDAIGQFLGVVSVRPAVNDVKNFSDLVNAVKTQNSHAKRNRHALWTINSMALMARLWDFAPLSVNRDFARKVSPMACALSNVNLGAPVTEDIANGIICDYFRAANLGVMVPLMLSNTTVGKQFNLCTTHKESVYSQEEVQQFVDCITNRICNS